MTFPNRDIVRPNGVYDPALEPLWDAALAEYYAKCPRHPCAGIWLSVNPMEGVRCEECPDGLGPRLCGWPEKEPHPDFETFAAAMKAERDAASAALAADIEALRKEDSAVSRQLLRLLGA